MNTAKLLILENRLGQKVRTFAVDARSMNIVFLKDQRRIEAIANLQTLDDNKIEYTLIKRLDILSLDKKALQLEGLGQLRLMDVDAVNSPEHQLVQEQDEKELRTILEKTMMGHVALVLILMLGAWISAKYFS